MTETDVAIAIAMWVSGCDTLAIGDRLCLHEALVYRALSIWREELHAAAKGGAW